MAAEETFAGLRQVDPRVPVLICSGHLRGERVEALLDRGALGFMQKPYTMRSLSSDLASAMSGPANSADT